MQPKTLKFEMPEYVVKNILIFLDRSKIDGAEAQALVEAKYFLSNPTPDQPTIQEQQTQEMK